MINWCRFTLADWQSATLDDWANACLCFTESIGVVVDAWMIFAARTTTAIDPLAPTVHLYVAGSPTTLFDPVSASFVGFAPAASVIVSGE